MANTTQKRMNKDEQSLIAQLARAFKISVSIDVFDWCELGERWSEREDTSENVVTIKAPHLNINFSLPLAWSIISQLSKITEIRLDQNDLEGGFPEIIPGSMERLYIDNNPRLGGQLPQSMRYRNLSVLWLNNCGLSGQLPYSIGDMWSLKQLNLSDNKLTGRLPDSWGTLPLLELLDLRQNRMKGSLPRSFKELDSLVQLDLSYNKFSGEIPQDRFTDLKHLRWLNLSNCNFFDADKSHRQLEQSLPNVKVHAHVPRRVYKPSPLPTFPRKGSQYQDVPRSLGLSGTSVDKKPSLDSGSLPESGDQHEEGTARDITLDSNGLPNLNTESQADQISDVDHPDDEDDDEEEEEEEEDE